MKKPKLTYKEDAESGLVELFVNGVPLVTWSYEDESSAEEAFNDFKKIFLAGYNYRVNAR